MAAVAANTKTYTILPSAGWTQIVTGAATPIDFLRISGDPHTHPFFVFAGATAPAATVRGVKVCHNAFKVYDQVNGISSIFYVRVGPNPSNQSGGVLIDVYSEGGVLS